MSFNANAILLSGSDQTLFQAPAGTEGAMHGLVFNNSGPEAAFLTLKFLDASTAITQIVLQDFLIPADSQFTWPKPIDLASGDAVIASGSGLVALQSTYIQTAVPAAVGFVGRGAWTSIASYNANDVVSYNNNSYLANNANTNSAPPSADWTLLAAQGAAGTITNTVRTPTAIYPLTGGLAVNPTGPLEASAYAPLYSVNARLYRTFQVTTAADTTFASPVFALNVDADTTLISPALTEDTNYIWRCRDVSEEGIDSDWMTTQSFLTKDYSVNTPTVTVQGSPSSVNQSPQITLSAYTTSPDQTATYASTDWEVRRVSDNVLVYSSYGDTVNVSTLYVPPGVLATSTAYAFRGRYNSTIYGSSAYGSTSATTLATFTQELYTALPFVASTAVTVPVAFPQNKIVAIDSTRSIQIYHRTNTDSSLGTTALRWYLAVVTNTANGPVTDVTKALILPDTAAIAGAFAPQFVMRNATTGYIVWSNVASTNVVFADFSVSGDTITLGTQTNIATFTTGGVTPTPSITTIRDGWYMVVYNHFDGTTQSTRLIGVDVTSGSPVVGSPIIQSSWAATLVASPIGNDRVLMVVNATGLSYIFSWAKPVTTLVGTQITTTVAPSISWNSNFSIAPLGNNRAMIIGYNSTNTRTVAIVISGLDGAASTQTYSPTYLFGTVLASAQGQVCALSASTVLYARPDAVSVLQYNATTGDIVETSRVITPLTTETVSITALQTPAIAAPNATAAHLYQGWGTATEAYTTLNVTVTNGLASVSDGVNVLGYANGPNVYYSSAITTLSPTRAIVFTREFYEPSTSYVSNVLSLFDTTGPTPVLLSRLNISGGLTIVTSTAVPIAVTALSATKVLVMAPGIAADTGFLSLITVSGDVMTLNQTVAYPAMYRNSADIARLTDTSALLAYVTAGTTTPKAQAITLDGAGTSMVIGTETAVGANTTTGCRVAALSGTRVIVTYTTYASLLEITGTSIATLQIDVSLAIGALISRIVPISATAALYCRTTTTTANLAVITMSGNTISVGATSANVTVVSGAEMSISPTTSTTGVLFSSQTSNLSIYTYSIAGTTVTPSAAVSSAIVTSGGSSSGAGIHTMTQPYVGGPLGSGYSLLTYRDNITIAGATASFKLQKYLRA